MTQNRNYSLSKEYVAAQTRAPIHGALVFAALGGLIAFGVTWRSSEATAIGLGIAALAGGLMFWKNLGVSRQRASMLPKLSVALSAEELRIQEVDHRISIPTSSIAFVTIDQRRGAPRVVYIRTVEGTTLQLEGLERFSNFTRDLSKFVGANKVREMKWWQFPPK